jgi:hypothetical protein
MVRRKETPILAPAALLLLEGPALTMVWANQRFYHMVDRITDDEVLGHSVNEYLPYVQSPEIERALNNALDTGESTSLEGEIAGSDGVMRIAATVYPLPDRKLLVAIWHPSEEPLREHDSALGRVQVREVQSG